MVRPVRRQARRSPGRPRLFSALLWIFGLGADAGAHRLCSFPKSPCRPWSGQDAVRRDHPPAQGQAIRVKTGTLVDATIIASASEDDEEGHWVKHKGRPAVHGFKAHVGADADTALVEEIAVTPANINDGKAGPDALPDNPGEVYADSAYRGSHFSDAVRAKGGTPRVIATGMWGRDEAETLARLDAWNQPIHRIRGRIEKIFGTWKRSYGLRRMRWRGLAKAGVQIRLTAIAYNMKRSLKVIAMAG
ncbi:transposase [Sinorhizobium sp. CCBAU 05631]|uniref:transposase n=1 Tax=Sinorhizobium sp. CCBAU 05631 TaxID=794846 RepID=UPI0032B018DF